MSGFLRHAHLGARPKEALAEYKYHGCDLSLVSKYVGQPFWNASVKLLPLWLAPNLVTFIGFVPSILSFLLLAYYNPLVEGIAPSWVYVFAAVCTFFYQTLDALDGKQARRTGSSSALGELFDHGCDALTTTLMGLSLSCVLQIGADWTLLLMMANANTMFQMAQWEEFHTGNMFLGYFGVTEFQLMVIFTYLWASIENPLFWLRTVSISGYSFEYNDFFVGFIIIGSIFTWYTYIDNVWRYLKKHNRQAEFLTALMRLSPIALLVAGVFSWAVLSPAEVYQMHPHEFIMAMGVAFANQVGRLVVARVTKQDYGAGFADVAIPFYLDSLMS